MKKLKKDTAPSQRALSSKSFRQAPDLGGLKAQKYFNRYSGSKKSYQKVWKDYSYFDEVIAQFKSPGAPALKTICVLGTGPGQILTEFSKHFKAQLHGCEINKWAYDKVGLRFKKNIKLQDMKFYLANCALRSKNFDLVFSNSLVYLDQTELSGVLDSIFKVSRYFHFNCSFFGSACPDPFRKILRSKRWWNNQLRKHGFKPLKNARGHHTYLWAGAYAQI